jgi:hypothetical protein
VFEDVNGEFISIVMFTPNNSTATSNPDTASSSGNIGSNFGAGGSNGSHVPTTGTDVGLLDVVLPEGFVATEIASAIRSYGVGNVIPTGGTVPANSLIPTRQTWDVYRQVNWTTGTTTSFNMPDNARRYWIDEKAAGRVNLAVTPTGRSVVQADLPPGNIISIKVMGSWSGSQHSSRYFEGKTTAKRPRPYERYQNNEMTGPIMVEGRSPAPVR